MINREKTNRIKEFKYLAYIVHEKLNFNANDLWENGWKDHDDLSADRLAIAHSISYNTC